jgi:hypothetical protein
VLVRRGQPAEVVQTVLDEDVPAADAQ